jgi:MFS family permease
MRNKYNNLNGSGVKNDFIAQDHMAIRASRADGSIAHIKKGYLFALLMVISIGTIQFGYSIGSWNTAFEAYKNKSGWDLDTGKKNQAFT